MYYTNRHTKKKRKDMIHRKIFRVTQLKEDLERWYSKTIFYALEHQTTERLKFKYLIPSPYTRVTIASTLNLYGTVSLEPSTAEFPNCLNMYPKELIPYMLWNSDSCKERSIADVSLNTYNDMIDLICETIGLYVNKREDAVLCRLEAMYKKLDEFYELDIKDQNTFYLFPMLAYIIQKTMDRLSDVNFGLSMVAER